MLTDRTVEVIRQDLLRQIDHDQARITGSGEFTDTWLRGRVEGLRYALQWIEAQHGELTWMPKQGANRDERGGIEDGA